MHTKQVAISQGSWHAWWLAMRPKTLSAGPIPILVGTLLAQSTHGVDWILAFYAVLFSSLIQIGTNITNDAFDFLRGADTKDRLGPIRVTQQGLLTVKQVLAGGFLCYVLAFIAGLPLIIHSGLPLLILVLASILCSFLYTGGPAPLAYHGLGEVFVIIFYGFIGTCAAFYIQTGEFTYTAMLGALQVGLLSCVMLAVNNMRDIREDAKANKRTLAVRFGATFARWETTVFIALPFLINPLWAFLGYVEAALLPFLTFPIAVTLIRNIWKNEPGVIFNKFLAQGSLFLLLFGILLCVGFVVQ